ncbi:glycoside hydrolase family 43 protein [Halalkalibacter krulwichiae]|uniref:Beta-xylosidase n=1 Tax=Halalkalibacter krulwichiae TaxID=199441 RepID=A0A1X9M7X9_9BACI|nr:glycoside hydrolase family 43 protein [Halalkalibacter krulwichiae]ARK29545.1 Beta-xylosidase [Halalkalibacter krulwichiae]
METFKNPILPGFYPDPSICRAGEDYYLVTSSFEYFPGVPIFHSKDLVNWRQIGHVLDRPSQLNLENIPCSKGIYAPTIRYCNGVFYMITTFVESQTGERRNFYVTATDPAGAWSEPIWLEDAPGIDPSLFFDEDGKVYFTANRVPPEGQQYAKHMEIYLQELDLESQKLVGPKYSLWDGALKQIHAQEGPHVYRVDGMYYLLIAEGGTGFTHSVTIARSETITGPYEVCKTNPILTHRHLGRQYPIINVGHADMVQTQTGEWWMVCLASRPYGGNFSNLGRETFLVPFVWEKGWPVVNPGKGIIEEEMPRPKLKLHRWSVEPACDHFDGEHLGQQWNFIRTPEEEFHSLNERPGCVTLKTRPETIMEQSSPSFIGRRQQHMNFVARTLLEFKPKSNEEVAGLVLLQSKDFQIRMECTQINDEQVIRLIKREKGEDSTWSVKKITSERIYLKVEAYGQDYNFYYSEKPEEWKVLIENVDGRILSMEADGGFVGTYIGLYTSSNGHQSDNSAYFHYFEYL